MATTHHLVLLGLMGSGKTSIGRRVAERLGWPLVDGDELLEQRTGGRTAADVERADGIDALHALEAEIALAALRSPVPSVIGPAASVVEIPEVRAALAEHLVVWFTGPAEHFAERAVRKSHRPLLDDGDPVELFRRQLAVREPLVRPFAACVIDVSRTSKEDAADQIAELVSRAAPTAATSSSPPPS